jgi:HD superfamily phosphohydrolase
VEKILNKKKIFNDPVYGFVTIKSDLIYDIIQHPYFQRLRRIKQLGMADYVYPGAIHTRFHHALGAMHLMSEALNHLQGKGVFLFDAEIEGALIAILLHDIGHGPFSHALEHSILTNVHHEDISTLLMERLNEEFDGKLGLAIRIFKKEYERPFLSQLVSSQLDIDRMDYLQRDCYFTGVNEGAIGAERIIKMLDVVDNNIVVEEKGIFSIENFLNARRLMYWQVYLHKTSIVAEQMLILVFKRAKHLTSKGVKLYASPALQLFLENEIGTEEINKNPSYLSIFAKLDDYDVWGAVKLWVDSKDKILAYLCDSLLDRNLFRIELSNDMISRSKIDELKVNIQIEFEVDAEDCEFLLSSGHVTNEAYLSKSESINVLTKEGEIIDVAQASDLPNIKAISKLVTKHYLCSPKKLSL